eukprot:6196283-Pleurochrysis_carterae.AAC.5
MHWVRTSGTRTVDKSEPALDRSLDAVCSMSKLLRSSSQRVLGSPSSPKRARVYVRVSLFARARM